MANSPPSCQRPLGQMKHGLHHRIEHLVPLQRASSWEWQGLAQRRPPRCPMASPVQHEPRLQEQQQLQGQQRWLGQTPCAPVLAAPAAAAPPCLPPSCHMHCCYCHARPPGAARAEGALRLCVHGPAAPLPWAVSLLALNSGPLGTWQMWLGATRGPVAHPSGCFRAAEPAAAAVVPQAGCLCRGPLGCLQRFLPAWMLGCGLRDPHLHSQLREQVGRQAEVQSRRALAPHCCCLPRAAQSAGPPLLLSAEGSCLEALHPPERCCWDDGLHTCGLAALYCSRGPQQPYPQRAAGRPLWTPVLLLL
jgi:hypothetical protein